MEETNQLVKIYDLPSGGYIGDKYYFAYSPTTCPYFGFDYFLFDINNYGKIVYYNPFIQTGNVPDNIPKLKQQMSEMVCSLGRLSESLKSLVRTLNRFI